MKPFDIELAKKKHPVKTKNGCDVRIICFDRTSDIHLHIDYPIVALVQDCGIEKIGEYTKEGYSRNSTFSDLVMATVEKEGWVNRYKAGVSNHIFPTKEEAEKAKGDALALGEYRETIKIIYHE